MKRLLLAMLMLPGICCADYFSGQTGQAKEISSLLISYPAAFLSRVPAPLMLSGFRDTPRPGPGFSHGSTAASQHDLSGEPLSWVSPSPINHMSVTDGGELALSESIGVFGQFGLRASAEDFNVAYLNDGASDLLQLAHHYGVGVNVWASEVLALHFEWERYAPGGEGADLTRSDWDPWKEKNVFGAGVRFGL